MKRTTSLLSTLSCITVLAAGCASAPANIPAPPPMVVTASDCDSLRADIARAEESRRVALEDERNAWKVVVPFAVAFRFGTSKSAATKSERQIETLRAELTRQDCQGQGI